MMRRILLWGGLSLVVLLAAAVWLLPRWLSGDGARERVEAILSEALGREVTIEALEVGHDGPVVELRGVTVAQPPALATPEEGPLLHADRLRLEVGLEELLEREVIGSALAQGVTLVVLERGGRTSVHGLGRPKDATSAPKGEPPQLALDVELTDVSVRLVDLDRGEAIDVRDIEIRGHLSNQPDTSPEAVATLEASALEVRGVALEDLMMQLRLDDDAVELVRLRARLGTGTVDGHGRLGRPAKGSEASGEGTTPGDWNLELTLADIALDGPLRDLAATVVPSVVRATGAPGEPTTGRLGAQTQLSGEGLHWSTVEPSLRGRASVELREVVVPADTTVLRLAGFAGREAGPWAVDEVSAEVIVADGWIRPRTLVLGELRPSVKGRVSLHGELDLTIDLMPFVERFGGGTYATVARTTSRLPVRITGTVEDPELAPPRATDVAKGLLGGALRRALDSSDE